MLVESAGDPSGRCARRGTDGVGNCQVARKDLAFPDLSVSFFGSHWLFASVLRFLFSTYTASIFG